jgi:homoserine dehydrogenase
VGIPTPRHGSKCDGAGFDAAQAASSVERGDALGPALSSLDAIRRLGSPSIEACVLVETTPLDIQSGEPAISHVRAAFAAGMHVITANKGPAAFAYRALAAEARRAGVSFLFEGAVMDGVPVFNLVRETLPAVTIRGFRGVVNSTTNHILSALERGESFASALARMQADGVAEADPSLDIDGWDAAAKTAALANVLLDADLTPQRVDREGLTAASGARARSAIAAGRRLKLVATATCHADGHDPLAILDDQANALELDTWPMGRIVITERDGGLEKTAYALVSDLVTVARRIRARR